MAYYQNIEPNGNNYRGRIKLGIHQTYTPTVETPQEAARDIDYLRAWLRATLADCLAERFESQITTVSTPPQHQDEKHKALLAAIPKSGAWSEQITQAPEWVARFITRIYSTEEISPA